MCGICGYINFSDLDNAFVFEGLKKMHFELRNRGPDDEGLCLYKKDSTDYVCLAGKATHEKVKSGTVNYFPKLSIEELSQANHFCGFGHRRLAILDISEMGHQPMASEDGRYWILFNGEIYNYQYIRDLLEKEGCIFRSDTDTEVILHAYALWGENCVERFNGMWAFAIWDNSEKKMFASRDRLGIKPFYYHFEDGLFLFASNIRALLASKLFKSEPNWEGVYHGMSFYCAPRPTTCFKSVFALRQGHNLVIDDKGSIKEYPYWSIPTGSPDKSKSLDFWVSKLKETAQDAVNIRLVGDRPLSILLSGGVDSTTVLGFAAEHSKNFNAFTLGYKGNLKAYDESSLSAQNAAKHKVKHIIRRVDAKDGIKDIRHMVRCLEEPYFSLPANYLIAKEISKSESKIVLTGLGPDELFNGYRRGMAVFFFKFRFFLRPFRFLVPRNFEFIKTMFDCTISKSVFEAYITAFSIFSEKEKKRLLGEQSNKWNSADKFRSLYVDESRKFSDDFEAYLFSDVSNYIGNHHVFREDNISMQFSYESRMPFLDYRFVELAFKIPSKYKRFGYRGKKILKKMSRDIIVKDSLKFSKKGFSLPLKQWMKKDLKFFVSDQISSLKKKNVVNPDFVSTLYTDFYSGKDYLYYKLWYLVSLNLWLEEFFEN